MTLICKSKCLPRMSTDNSDLKNKHNPYRGSRKLALIIKREFQIGSKREPMLARPEDVIALTDINPIRENQFYLCYQW